MAAGSDSWRRDRTPSGHTKFDFAARFRVANVATREMMITSREIQNTRFVSNTRMHTIYHLGLRFMTSQGDLIFAFFFSVFIYISMLGNSWSLSRNRIIARDGRHSVYSTTLITHTHTPNNNIKSAIIVNNVNVLFRFIDRGSDQLCVSTYCWILHNNLYEFSLSIYLTCNTHSFFFYRFFTNITIIGDICYRLQQ